MTAPFRSPSFLMLGFVALFTACAVPFGATAPPTGEPASPSTLEATGTRIVDAGLEPSGLGWVLTDASLEVSTDSGRAWLKMTPSGLDPSLIVGVDFSSWPSIYLVAAEPAGGLTLWSKIDGMTSWTSSALPGTHPDGIGGVSIQYPDTDHGFIAVTLPSSSAGSRGMLLSTTNGGTTWSSADLPVGGAIHFASPRNGWILGGPLDGQLYRTNDGGDSWSPVSLTTPNAAAGHQPSFELPTITGAMVILPVRWIVNGGGPLFAALYTSPDFGDSWMPAGELFRVADEGSAAPMAVSATEWLVVTPTSLVTGGIGDSLTSAIPVGLPLDGIVKASLSDTGTVWAISSTSSCASFKEDCSVDVQLWARDGSGSWVALTP
jgi:hypothetical protein